jgi:RNA polymerase sigma-70 factor (ECF subfamily)
MAPESGGRSFGALRLVSSAASVTATGDTKETTAARAALDDQDLLAALRSGQPQRAAQLCDRLWPQVTRTIRRLLGRYDSDREDLAQISLMEIVNTIAAYRGDCSLDRWAQTVTAHVVFKHLRRRNLERRLFSEYLLDDVHAGPVQIEQSSATRELLGQVATHLESMNPRRVWAFLLHDVLGYDLHEIAEMTGSTTAAAQSRLSRGRRELHGRIAKDPALVDLLQKVTSGVVPERARRQPGDALGGGRAPLEGQLEARTEEEEEGQGQGQGGEGNE